MADNVRETWKFLRGKGLTPAQAAGVIGSMQGESGKNLDPKARNPSSGAYGIAQWLGGRKTSAVTSGSLRAQLNHLWGELQGPERAALKAIKSAHTPEQAAVAWQRVFERGAPHEQKYDLRARNARDVFRQLRSEPGGGSSPGGGGGGGSGGSTRTITETTPGVDNSAARRSLVLDFLGNKNSDVLDFAVQAKQLADIPGTTTTRTERMPGNPGQMGEGDVGAGGLAQTAASRADIIDRQRLPYSWGGGHGGKTPINKAIPLDCSGAVSKVLGIDPRVSGAFGKWGRPGDGGSKGVTVYSNGHHVLMKINGHFFGTSGTNPGGGAGWIPQSAISPEYLKGFTARHSNR